MRQLLTLVESILVIWMKLFVAIVLGFVALIAALTWKSGR